MSEAAAAYGRVLDARAAALRERNPLAEHRPGGLWVHCPRCGAEGEAWAWELRRAPAYAAHTVPVYRCRAAGCGHVFALGNSER